ncbi:MAG: T9SS type A sorting domain-containing protein [Flavobacteriales bacterium]|nr:T9SS type A sorting domain-containing protein [Flavobacteriales bacterium]
MTSNAMNNRRCGWATGLGACYLLFVALNCEAQNLVPNGSFEETDSCWQINTWYYPETGPLGWFSTAGSGDYYLSCLTYGAFNGVPLSAWAFQYPQEGSSYVGVITYSVNAQSREFFAIELAAPLQVGSTYYASFYASASWNGFEQYPQCYLASSHVGMRFTVEAQQWDFGDPLPPFPNSAQVDYPAILADTVNWVLVSASFVADSAYRYVLIGNHFDNAHTDTLHLGSSIQYARAHTLIDNVCVSLDPLGCPLVNGIAVGAENNLVFFPNPVSDVLRIQGVAPGQRVSVQDVCGRLIWWETGTGREMSWDVQGSAPGMYLLRVERAGGFRSFKFVVKE